MACVRFAQVGQHTDILKARLALGSAELLGFLQGVFFDFSINFPAIPVI